LAGNSDQHDRLISRLTSRADFGLHRRSLADGGEVYSGPLAQQALRAVGARAMTMDKTIFVDESFDLSNPEDQALYAHERLHQLESGGMDEGHGAHDQEEVAARAIERMVLHRAQSGENFSEIMRDVDINRAKEVIQKAANDSGDAGDSLMAGYSALLGQGHTHQQVVELLALHVTRALNEARQSRAQRGPDSKFI